MSEGGAGVREAGIGAAYLETAGREASRLRRLAERALAQVDDAGFFASSGGQDNSLAVLVKHVAGNMRSRWTDFLTADGEKPDRARDTEFDVSGDDREPLMTRWAAGWQLFEGWLARLDPSDLEREVRIRGEAFTVLQAVERALTHYAYHIGQIVQTARREAGPRWETLSIARGRSEAFDRRPGRYLER